MKRQVESDIPLDIQIKLKEIGVRVRRHRKVVEKNYEVFARDHQINKVTLARIECGQNFTMSSFLQVLNALDISPDKFFTPNS